MAALEDILARFPDNDSGEIDADDLRFAISELWDYTSTVQRHQNDLVVRVGGMVGVGEIDTTGTMVGGPNGWTSERVEAGVYRVTHRLGHENYAVAVTPMIKTTDGYSTAITETTADDFTLQVYEIAKGEVHDAYVSFILVANQ